MDVLAPSRPLHRLKSLDECNIFETRQKYRDYEKSNANSGRDGGECRRISDVPSITFMKVARLAFA